jgi:hypothetical protein
MDCPSKKEDVMNRKILFGALFVSTVVFLHAGEGFPQTAENEFPTGFMIQGALPQQLMNLGYVYMGELQAPSVPYAVVGYRGKRFSLGLGISFLRGAYHEKYEGDTYKDILTAMTFTPRVEISLFQSSKGLAEAYLAAGFGVGFHRFESKGDGNEDSATDVVLGGLVGLGGRCFLGGSPFALGLEFGWSGLFLHFDEDYLGEGDTMWANVSGVYGALTGQFVFR